MHSSISSLCSTENPKVKEPASLKQQRLPINRVLNIAAAQQPKAAWRARIALDLIQAPLRDVSDWSASQLTGDGYPLEFSFGDTPGEIRYTADVAAAQVQPHQRVNLAWRKLETLLQMDLDPRHVREFQALQNNQCLRYGAWIGGRHSEEGDGYKLYLELPGNSTGKSRELLSHYLAQYSSECGFSLTFPGCRSSMLGYEPVTQSLEFYFAAPQLAPWELNKLLSHAGMVRRYAKLVEYIESACGRSIDRELPTSRAGFSFAMKSTGEIGAFSIFFVARSIFGSDRKIRQGVLKLADQYKWLMGDYAKVSEPLNARNGWRTAHGFVGFTFRQSHRQPYGQTPGHCRGTRLHIDLRPPELC